MAEIYDAAGNKLDIRPSTDDEGKNKGKISFDVGPPSSHALSKRLVRGLVDAAITALVPVVTVALTQVQNGGDLGVDKLVLLGFTSQAIRAAVLPESVSTPPEPQPARANTAA